MPPKIQFTKADLLRAAFKITRHHGIHALNARAIAKELGCSTQPIFRAFRSMDEVRCEMMRMAMDLYGLYITRSSASVARPYLHSGLAYISFAREEAELFKLLFMRDRVSEGTDKENSDSKLDYVIGLVMESTGLTQEHARRFHRHLWIYTHGLATMVATKFLNVGVEEAEQLLGDQYHATRALFALPPLPR